MPRSPISPAPIFRLLRVDGIVNTSTVRAGVAGNTGSALKATVAGMPGGGAVFCENRKGVRDARVRKPAFPEEKEGGGGASFLAEFGRGACGEVKSQKEKVKS